MSMDEPMVSVIVPCRNEAGHIRALLESVLGQEAGGLQWEVIVADGMSDDGTREILAEYARRDARVRVIDNPARIVSAGLNAAVQAARGEIVLRMDVHTEYAPDYIRQGVAVLKETGAANVGGPWVAAASGLMGRAVAAAFHAGFCSGGAKAHKPSYEGPVDTVYLGCWPKETLLRAGLFDERLVRNQDDELNLRLRRMGELVWQSPRIRSWYRPRASLGRLFRQYLQYGFWKVEVIRKHRLPASGRHLAPGVFVLANLGLPVLWAAGTAVGAERAATAAGWVWFWQAAAYGAATLAASVVTAARKGWGLLPLLPVVFATYHVAYGLGFMAGVVHLVGRRGTDRLGEAFTAISR